MRYWYCYYTYNDNPATGPVEGAVYKSESCPPFCCGEWMEISESVYEWLSGNGPDVYRVLFFRNISNEHIVVSDRGDLLFSGYRDDCDDVVKLYPGSTVYLRRDYIFSLIEMRLFNKLKDWLCRPKLYSCSGLSTGRRYFRKVEYSD